LDTGEERVAIAEEWARLASGGGGELVTITLSDTEIEKIAKFLDAQEGASVDGPIPEASEVNGIFRNALIGALRKRYRAA